MRNMRYLSLFSGIEAATVAWETLGWEPVAFAEIEGFPSAVLERRYPDVPNLGDVTKVDWSKYRGKADVLVGGAPCQAFSVAGLRKGLRDPRGNMTLEYLRAVDEVKPEYVVFENVPGIISDRTHAFEIFLESLQQMGYLIDMDILDAQYFGVAQRRKRVFVVGWRVETLLEKGGATARLLVAQMVGTAIRQALDGDATVALGRLASFGMASAEDLVRWLGFIGCQDGGSLWGALNDPDGAETELARWIIAISEKVDAMRPALPIFANEGLSILEALKEFAAHAKQETEQPCLFDGFDDVLHDLGREAARRAESLGDVAEACTREVLPDPESLPRHPETGREKRQALAGAAGRGADAGGDEGVASGFCGYASHTASSVGYQEEQSPTLKGNDWQCQVPDVLQSVTHRMAVTQYGDEVAGTLTARADGSACPDRGPNVVCQGFVGGSGGNTAMAVTDGCSPCVASNQPVDVLCMASGQANAEVTSDGTSPTITCLHERPIVCMADDNAKAAVDIDVCGTLKCGGGRR